MTLKYYCMYCKSVDPWSNPAFCGIWSESKLFTKAYLSQYLVITLPHESVQFQKGFVAFCIWNLSVET